MPWLTRKIAELTKNPIAEEVAIAASQNVVVEADDDDDEEEAVIMEEVVTVHSKPPSTSPVREASIDKIVAKASSPPYSSTKKSGKGKKVSDEAEDEPILLPINVSDIQKLYYFSMTIFKFCSV